MRHAFSHEPASGSKLMRASHLERHSPQDKQYMQMQPKRVHRAETISTMLGFVLEQSRTLNTAPSEFQHVLEPLLYRILFKPRPTVTMKQHSHSAGCEQPQRFPWPKHRGFIASLLVPTSYTTKVNGTLPTQRIKRHPCFYINPEEDCAVYFHHLPPSATLYF